MLPKKYEEYKRNRHNRIYLIDYIPNECMLDENDLLDGIPLIVNDELDMDTQIEVESTINPILKTKCICED